MSSVGASSQQASSGKKQKSISSFFTAKPAPTTKESQVGATQSPVLENGDAAGDKLFVSSDEDDIPQMGRKKRSSRQGKRLLEADENEDPENDVLPQAKRLRRNNTGPKSPTSQAPRGANQSTVVVSPPRQSILTQENVPRSAEKGTQSSTTSARTSKYIFGGSSQPASGTESGAIAAEEDSPEVQKKKERLHERFVKKLGKPDSIAEIKRKNRFITEEADQGDDENEAAGDNDEDEGDGAVAAAPSKATAVTNGKRGVAAKKGGGKLTPLEKQVLEIKRKHPDTLLVVEVGYKFRFFGEDARVAAKELSIVCIPGKYRYDEHPSEAHIGRFASASIPVHRLHVHVKRLVAAGNKVGVVRQLETAALKAAGDNRNAPFSRRLTNLYTKGTYVDDIEGLEEPAHSPGGDARATGYLLCLTESNAKGWGTDEKVQVGVVAVQPATGDVIYDDFEDGFMRSELETRLLHISPCEFLIIGELSSATEKLVQHLSGSSKNIYGEEIRIERVPRPKTMAAQSYSHVSNFYAGKMKASQGINGEKASNFLDKVLKLSEHVTICLSGLINHMADYGLEHVFDLTKYFQSFSARSHMLINGNTLTSLEIYRNQTDHTEKGSLFWTMDRTQTRFGQRLFRKWVGRPLLDRKALEERVTAVEELKDGEHTTIVGKLKALLSKIRIDLEKNLIRIYYGKCTRPELLNFLQTMQRISTEFANVKSAKDVHFSSAIVNEAVAALPTILNDIVRSLEKINPDAARKDDKYCFFRDDEETEDITEQKLGIASVEHELDVHRPVAAEKIRKKKVDFVTVAGIEYLIEIDNKQLKNVPASWAKISGTRSVSRFHTPEVVRLIRERDQHKEALAAACDDAFAALLTSISEQYQSLRDTIQALATLDCLLSLATVASQPGYVKPEYTDETRIHVEQGRHPMVEQLLLDTYVANDIDLSSEDTRALLITGPNMGGKSSYVRQVALIAIMGQIGSYVPAVSAKLGMLDAIFTRMGAFDNMMAGESTFMVELSETSDILKQASPRSLVILDELGRGTSTHDGVAIAQAVLDYIVRESKCLTLFITHYQALSTLAKGYENEELKNVHMRFTEGGQGGQEITFLYEVGQGVAHRSYGLNVARLANVPESVLATAAVKSRELEEEIRRKRLLKLMSFTANLPENDAGDRFTQFVAGLEQL
ncbi:MAG: Mismatch repair protein msh3 [Sclerophora amabilis]|nr:MAG: Mismatch repair protein msh3 [Sclerophora amabilis]